MVIMIISAYMVPHPPIAVHQIGRGEEMKIRKTLQAYDKVSEMIADDDPETIVISSPHAPLYRDWFNVSSGNRAYGDFSRFRARNVTFDVPYDTEFVKTLDTLCKKEDFPAGTEYDRDKMLDHGTMVPLYFLSHHMRGIPLVRIGLSGLSLRDHYRLGMLVQEVSDILNRRVVFIASGDLSHCQKEDGPYGFKPEGPVYDERIMHTMANADFNELFDYQYDFLEKAEECGHRSFVIMAGALDGLHVMPKALSHEAAFGVGYGIVTYEADGKDDSRHFLKEYDHKEKERIQIKREHADAYVKLALDAIAYYQKHESYMSVPDNLPAEMYHDKAGTFVSIHEDDRLRGCIGTIRSTRKNIACEIIHNAVSACSRDPRFPEIKEEEYPYLDVSVDVLSKPEKISDRSMLDVKKYGVICSVPDGRMGLLLPDLDGVDTVDFQIKTACRKGDIDPDDPHLQLQRFTVTRHE